MKGMTVKEKLSRAFTPKGSISKGAYCLLSFLLFLIIFLFWCYAVYVKKVDGMFLPSPGKTLTSAKNMFLNNNFLMDIRMSVQRVLIGFLISAAIGIPLGLLIGTYAPVSAFFEPFFSFFRYLPASAFIQLFILWIGIGEGAKVAIIIVGSIAQIILMVATNVRNVPLSLIEVSYTLGVSKFGVFWKIILPKCMPDIVDTLRIVLGWAGHGPIS